PGYSPPLPTYPSAHSAWVRLSETSAAVPDKTDERHSPPNILQTATQTEAVSTPGTSSTDVPALFSVFLPAAPCATAITTDKETVPQLKNHKTELLRRAPEQILAAYP